MIRTGTAIRPRRPRKDGVRNTWMAMRLLVLAEALLFCGLLYAFFYFRTTGQGQWPPGGQPLDLLAPSLSLGVLLLSSLTIGWAGYAARRDRQLALKIAMVATSILGLLFVDGQIYEYLQIDMTLDGNVFAGVFYLITGFHALHVVGGVLINLMVTLRALGGLVGPTRMLAMRCAELYWHFVVVAWVVLFALLYLF
jgi:cytochrome c oxidase subunit III